jgi:hypothetical protein
MGVEAVMLDQAGRVIATLHSGTLPGGSHRLSGSVEHLPAGVYFLMVTGNGDHFTRKVLITR